MRFALITFLCCAFVTALNGEDALERWAGLRGEGKVSNGDNNIGNGDTGGINIDTGGGDIGAIGVGVGGSCDPAACDAKVTNQATVTLGLLLGQSTPRCICAPTPSTITTVCPTTITTTTSSLDCASLFSTSFVECQFKFGTACPLFTQEYPSQTFTTFTDCCACDSSLPSCSFGPNNPATALDVFVCGIAVVSTSTITTVTTAPCITVVVDLVE